MNVYEKLCIYDKRNPDYDKGFVEEFPNKPKQDCYCDNCFYGRTELALELIKQQTKIWCLFSIENNYDQPDNNLEAWWTSKPHFLDLKNEIVGETNKYDLQIGNIIRGKSSDIEDYNYRLEQVEQSINRGK